jgi:hypothetical protein
VSGYQAGATVYELGREYGIERRTVSRILERQGVSRRYRRLTGKLMEEAVAAYQRGDSLATISTRIDLPQTNHSLRPAASRCSHAPSTRLAIRRITGRRGTSGTALHGWIERRRR